MPGMWDCHGHFMGARSFDLNRVTLEPSELRAARCARDLRAALDAGITSVREVGGFGVYLARAVDEGVLDGPAIYAAGAILSTTGATATCTPSRWPGWTTCPGTGAWSGWRTGPTSAPRPPASSCGATRG